MTLLKYSKLLILVFAASFTVSAQNDWKIYDDADRFMQEGEFDLALEAFRYISHLPDVPYKSSICALMSERIKNQPVENLLTYESEKATTDPLYYYWLGKVYLKRLWTEDAKNSFDKFLNSPMLSKAGNQATVEVGNLISLLEKNTVSYTIIPLESPINSTYAESGAVFSDDGKRLIFGSDRNSEGMLAIYETAKGPYGWDSPELISCIPATSQEYLNVIPVKNQFYFFDLKTEELYFFNKTEEAWGKPEAFKTGVLTNTKHVYLNQYKTRMIFSVKTEENKLDIYESLKLRTTGEWTMPLPVAEEINSPYNEDYPFLTEDRKRLYFCSDRPGGLGEMDVYFSEYHEEKSKWSTPENLGAKINSMDNEIDFKMLNDEEGLFSSDRLSSRGSLDIYHFAITN